MAQQDYGKPVNVNTEAPMPKFVKNEETGIPQFAKEVPLKTILKKHGSRVMIQYEWDVLGGEEIKIRLLDFKNDENLQYMHKIKIRDGDELGSFRIANSIYVIRKTSEEVAKELAKTGGAIKASVSKALGYLETMKGNFYVISRVDADSWSMDSRTGLKLFSLQGLGREEKRNFLDLLMTEIIKLYAQGYALKGFDLGDIIVTKKEVVLGNAAAIAKASASECVESFLANVKLLVESGIADRGDAVYAIALSLNQMRKQYEEWAGETRGAGKLDDLKLVAMAEEHISS